MRELDPNSLGDHLDRLYRAAWALCGSREDAEDLVQDTFAKILTRPRFLRGEDDLWYLMRTLKNVFLSQRRTLARRSPPVPLDEDVRPRGGAELVAAGRGCPEARGVHGDRRSCRTRCARRWWRSTWPASPTRRPPRRCGVRQGTITSRLFRARARVAKRSRPEAPQAASED